MGSDGAERAISGKFDHRRSDPADARPGAARTFAGAAAFPVTLPTR
jgi:hypothetical protein